MGLTVDILVTYGVSSAGNKRLFRSGLKQSSNAIFLTVVVNLAGIDILRSLGLVTVSDLATLDTDSLAQQG